MRKPTGELNGVRVHRLKDKYGTKGLPTAELELDGMEAYMVKSNRIRLFSLLTHSLSPFRSVNLAAALLPLPPSSTSLVSIPLLVSCALFVDALPLQKISL
jgi:hypothetical protein